MVYDIAEAQAVLQQIEEHGGPEIVKLDAAGAHLHNELALTSRLSPEIPDGNAMHVRIDDGASVDIGVGEIGADQR